MDYNSLIIIPRNTPVYPVLDRLAAEARVVCFSGLPAVGKSLYIKQFSYMALSRGRAITTLQWDKARQAYETTDWLSRYPESDGITHPAIRKACGLWSRKAVSAWSLQNNNPEALLIIEAPLIGNRLVELASPVQDEDETFLSSQSVQFVIPVPSSGVRAAIEARRRATSAAPQHEQEKADANPFVVAVLSRELCDVAIRLGYPGPAEWHQYNPALYEFVYRAVLRYRNTSVLPIDFLLNTPESVYDVAWVDKKHLVPDADEVAGSLELVLKSFPSPDALQKSVDAWYLIGQTM